MITLLCGNPSETRGEVKVAGEHIKKGREDFFFEKKEAKNFSDLAARLDGQLERCIETRDASE